MFSVVTILRIVYYSILIYENGVVCVCPSHKNSPTDWAEICCTGSFQLWITQPYIYPQIPSRLLFADILILCKQQILNLYLELLWNKPIKHLNIHYIIYTREERVHAYVISIHL